MLRIHFTAQDVLRVRFAGNPAPLMELCLALATAQRTALDPSFARWRHTIRSTLPSAARPILELVPASATGPMFLDPVSQGLDDGLDTVLSSPAGFVRNELRRVCAVDRTVTPWITDLARRDAAAWHALDHALRAGHTSVLEPVWSRVCASFDGDLAWRSRLIAEEGLHAMFAGLYPGNRWQGSTLCIDKPTDAEVHLGGRGLTLLPSAFWPGPPTFGVYPDGSALMVYPALTALPLVEEPGSRPDALSALLGPTRAAVLQALTGGRTTSEISRALGISLATASEHARTLRSAGLITTRRTGKSVMHRCTALGTRLLNDPP